MVRQIAHIFLFIILYSTAIYSQGWFWQNLPQDYTLSSIDFVNELTGWVVGVDGIIQRTTDGGTTWVSQSSGTTNYLRAVSFTDSNNSTAVGEDGIILRTTDGGTTWVSQ